ncbi:MAG: transporter substrate-binding domain-containing protein [Acidimicrobiaceae bacterium]|nr:transporter substrate-binding domain-containing protein [Acidimicrobiaceae bacterium]
MSSARLPAALVLAAVALGSCGGSDRAGAPVQQEATTSEAAEATTTAAEATTTRVTSLDIVSNGVPTNMLDKVQYNGELVCGVSGTRVIFSETQPDGSVVGVDADFCRVMAAALFGDADAVEFVSLTTGERFAALQSGRVDVLFRSTTWTQSRDTEVGLDFGPVIYYDGQQLMARESDGFSASSQVGDIAGAVVCALAGTTTEQNVSDAADAAGIDITLTTLEDFDVIIENFITGACDVTTADGSALAGRKAKQQPDDQEWVIFPAIPISKEPLAPVYPQNQSRFGDVVNWAVYATIIADEKGITSDNVAEMVAGPPDAEARRLLGGEGELQSAMGLAPDAFYQAISQVGNYGEILARHLEPAGLTRGSINASWRDGGLIYAPPAR